MKASESGHMECVKVLLDRCADVNMQNKVSVVEGYLLETCSPFGVSNGVLDFFRVISG